MTSAHQPDTTKGGLQLNAAYLKCMISILMSMSKSFQSQSTMTRIFHHLGRLLPDAVGVHIEWLSATLNFRSGFSPHRPQRSGNGHSDFMTQR